MVEFKWEHTLKIAKRLQRIVHVFGIKYMSHLITCLLRRMMLNSYYSPTYKVPKEDAEQGITKEMKIQDALDMDLTNLDDKTIALSLLGLPRLKRGEAWQDVD